MLDHKIDHRLEEAHHLIVRMFDGQTLADSDTEYRAKKLCQLIARPFGKHTGSHESTTPQQPAILSHLQ